MKHKKTNILKDETEKIRAFFNLQYAKIKKTAAVGSLILLTINLAVSSYPYIEHRGIHPYIAMPLLFLAILFVVWLLAHVYVRRMEMYRTEMRADMMLNPYAVYAIAPFEEMRYRYQFIPILRALEELLPKGEKKQRMKECADNWQKWVDLGYIPKEDYPKHLLHYYITDKARRL